MRNIAYRSFEDARKYVQSLKIKSIKEYRQYWKIHRIPDDLPKSPHVVYKEEWTSWGDFLGTGRTAYMYKKFRSFKDARKFVHSLKFTKRDGTNDWRAYCKSGKKPVDIPAAPDKVYKNKGWISFGDWLGTNNVSYVIKSKNYLPWKEAKPIYRRLAKEYRLKNGSDWKKFAKSHKKLLDKLHLPAQPWTAYSKERVWRKMK